MRQRYDPPADNLYKKIAELEKKLNRANRFIKRLRQENADLQRQLSSLLLREPEEPQLLVRDIPLFPTQEPSRRRRQRTKYPPLEETSRARRPLRKRRRLARIYQVRLAAIVLVVIGVFFSIGLIVTSAVRAIYQPPTPPQPSPQPSAKVIELPESPLLPPESPTATQTVSLEEILAQKPDNIDIAYNVTTPPDLKPSDELQAIVDEMVKMAEDKNLPVEDLSITLINVKTGETAGYQQQELRYPASLIKMFWMVYLYALIDKGIFSDESAFAVDLYKMIQHSNNDSAGKIVDFTTGATSGPKLEGDEYQTWLEKRLQLNNFFQKAGYEGIVLAQKTYPAQQMGKPEGRDRQMWKDSDDPMKNKVSSEQAARLMYEIVTGKAVSAEASRKMVQLLARDLHPSAWNGESETVGGFNPIAGFLGQSLPPDEVDFASKAGWTSTSRTETAFVKTRDGQTAYIVSILGKGRPYANDGKLFPQMSRFMFDRLHPSPSNQSPESPN